MLLFQSPFYEKVLCHYFFVISQVVKIMIFFSAFCQITFFFQILYDNYCFLSCCCCFIHILPINILPNTFFSICNWIRYEFLSRINWIYYWRLFWSTHEHYNYLQLTKLIKMENYIQKILKLPALIKHSSMIESSSLH